MKRQPLGEMIAVNGKFIVEGNPITLEEFIEFIEENGWIFVGEIWNVDDIDLN